MRQALRLRDACRFLILVIRDKALEMVPAKERFVRGPVGWLLGPELISKLLKILRKRSDPRDWMPYYRGCVHDECWQRDGKIVEVDRSDDKPHTAAGHVRVGCGAALASVCAGNAANRQRPAGLEERAGHDVGRRSATVPQPSLASNVQSQRTRADATGQSM